MKERANRIFWAYICMFIIGIFFSCVHNSDIPEIGDNSLNFIFRPDQRNLQLAIWLENENGDYIGTVFLTDFIGRNGGGNRTRSRGPFLSGGVTHSHPKNTRYG